jgi:hypothetical protein
MGQDGVVLNTSGWNKSKLVRRDEMIEQSLESISQNFGDDIAQTDGLKMMHRRSPQLLRNESNKRVVLLF